MSDGGGSVASQATGPRDFEVKWLYHPSHDVHDLDEAEAWYEKVFGCSSASLKSLAERIPPRPGSGYPPDYSTFTLIADVLFDTIDPTRYLFEGVQRLPSIKEPHLRLISWNVQEMDALFRALGQHGFRVTNQVDQIVTGDRSPCAFGTDMPLLYTHPDDTGLRYSFSPPSAVKATDNRSIPGWSLQEPASDDPLGVRFCSYHTILTSDPSKGIKLHCDVLGGEIIHEGRNELRGTSSIYVRLADAIIEFAVPDAGTPAFHDWQKRAPYDTYHALTWVVADLAKAEQHLARNGVEISQRSADTLITRPETALGIPWGFTTARIPGDTRP